MLDLKITGGTIVDGTGRPGFRGDVGVRDGRIVAVGQVTESARETIDASGRVVSPGFIDVHTHFDAQVFWEPTLSPSCFHGVTTVVGGFCGFSIAPISPESADYIKPMLARVEGMPLATLDKAVPWSWTSFGEYLSKIEGKVGLNAGFFAGHSAIRRVVMGKRAVGEKATPDDLQKMKSLLGKSLSEGALGFSTTVSPTHNDGDGNPVPSRWADRNELVELAGVVKDHPGTGLEFLPEVDWGNGMPDLMADLSIAANRPLNWNVLVVTARPNRDQMVDEALRNSDLARARGGEVIALTVPDMPLIYMNLRTGFIFDALPGLWSEIFRVPVEERIKKFSDPAVRRKLAADIASVAPTAGMAGVAKLEDYRVSSVRTEKNKKYEGRKIGEIAAQEKRECLDVLLDIAVADGLDTVFLLDMGAHDKESFEVRGKLWADDRTLIGASDAGAHLDLIDTFAFSTSLLELGVRKHKVISLEKAIHKITQRPATYFGFIDRGVIAQGYHADLVVFDANTVARGPVYQRFDLPGGNDFRLYAEAVGIDHVIVNGTPIVREGKHTGKLPGTVLKSGRDTRTVPLDALRDRPAQRAAE